MKYIVCEKPGNFTLKEKAAPRRKPHEALLRIRRVGICGTDLHAYAGNQPFFRYPRILGHELAAEVLDIGENEQGLRAGSRVIVVPYLSCGQCVACRNGKTNCCAAIEVLGVHADGGLQEQVAVPTHLLIPAEGLSLDEIAVAEPLAIGAHALRRAAVQAGEWVVVVGCGPIGIGLMKLALLEGARVIALDVNDQRLAFAREKIGVNHALRANDAPLERIREITQGGLATAVFDATGNKAALEAGVQYMAHGGRYVLVGLSKGELAFSHPAIHSKETTLMCSRNATFGDFFKVRDILSSGRFPVESYITHRVAFAEMIRHFESWLRPENGVMKAMVEV